MKKVILWSLAGLLALLAVVWVSVTPALFGGLVRSGTTDRDVVLSTAREVAKRFSLGPTEPMEAWAYVNDDAAQSYIELKAGGLDKLLAVENARQYTPARWTVRRYTDQNVLEVSVFVDSWGRVLGWSERLPESEVLPNLDKLAAEALAIETVKKAGIVDPTTLTRGETSAVTQPQGRVDWTLQWELVPSPLAEARVLLKVTVSGNRVTGIEPSLKVPEAFQRWFDNERSTNSLISSFSLVGMGGLLLLAVILSMRWARSGRLAWRSAWWWGAALGLATVLPSLNSWSQLALQYDTGTPFVLFWATLLAVFAGSGLLMAWVTAVTVVSAQAVSKQAFPDLWGRAQWSWRTSVLALIGVPLFLAYEVIFGMISHGSWGWWSPTSGIADPNVVSQIVPWLSPFGMALQAGVWEELLFRALPLGLAVLAGRKWGRPRLWMGVALVGQAVVFAAAHASYPGLPGWSRLVELLIPALGLGLVQLRWGVLPAILIHFGYDFVLMASPLFQTPADSLTVDRAMVVVLVLASVALPGVWGWSRRRQKAPEAPVEQSVLDQPVASPAPAGPAPASPVVVISSDRRPVTMRTWALWGALSLLGVVAVVTLGRLPDLGLAVDRTTAQAIATRALADQGLAVPPTATLDVTVQVDVNDDDRYVRAQAGSAVAAELRKRGFLPPVRWVFQWTDYEAPVEKRERWVVSVADSSGPRRVLHQVPAALAGETLTQDEAVARSLAEITKRLDLPATTLKLVAANQTKQPARLDWGLDFEVDPAVAGLSLRVHAEVSGGVVTDVYRFVFVPEDWSRTRQAESSAVGLVNGTMVFAVFALMIWMLVRGARTWTAGQAWPSVLVVMVIGSSLAFALSLLNSWGNVAFNFAIDQPWLNQALIQLGTVVALAIAFAMQGFSAAALVQPRSWNRPSLVDLLPAVVAGAVLSGALTAITAIFPLGISWAPSFAWASATVPGVNAILDVPTSLIVIVMMWFVLAQADRLAATSGWKPWVFVFVAGLIWHGGLDLDTWTTVLGRGLSGGVLACVLWALLRGRPALVMFALACGTLLNSLWGLGQSYPGAWFDELIGIAANLAFGWALAGLTIRTQVFHKDKD